MGILSKNVTLILFELNEKAGTQDVKALAHFSRQ